MMISTKGRYALRVLIDMAEHRTEGYIPLKVIAERQDISEKYLESSIVVLSKAGLLDGVRGKGGGYRLTKAPGEYSIGSILKLTEGSLAPVPCIGDEKQCSRPNECRTHPVWQKLDRLIDDYVESVTLADLINNQV